MNTEPNSLKSLVYQETLDGIISGAYKANQILNGRNWYKNSESAKSPVREALIALCNEGAYAISQDMVTKSSVSQPGMSVKCFVFVDLKAGQNETRNSLPDRSKNFTAWMTCAILLSKTCGSTGNTIPAFI